MTALALALHLALGATTPGAPAPRPADLAWDARVDIPVTTLLTVGVIISELAKPGLAPDACRWCETNAFDTGVRRAFHPSLAPSAKGVKPYTTISDFTGFVALPVLALGLDALLAWHDGALADAAPVDVLLMLEAVTTALALTQLTKYAVGRARPYSIGASAALLAEGSDPADANLSFFSGHTSISFAIAGAAATVMTLRGYRYAWVAWLVGMPLATGTALLRLAGDKHWASDVLVGLGVGLGAGIGVPLLFHRPVRGLSSLRVSPGPGGLSVAGAF